MDTITQSLQLPIYLVCLTAFLAVLDFVLLLRGKRPYFLNYLKKNLFEKTSMKLFSCFLLIMDYGLQNQDKINNAAQIFYSSQKTITMGDDKNKKDFKDSTRVNTSEPYDVQYWSERFNVSPQKLKEAVDSTGSNNMNIIEEHLKGKSRK